MGFNIIAELKNIASGITTSDPNTELGNINSGVGNLDTAMQGVATAINGLSIPNTGSNIDGVATAINNKSIPDPTTALSNINGNMLILESAINGVSTAINNKNIPDPNTQLANIGTIIGTKVIPDPNTGLADVVTAINNLSGMFGGKFYVININNYSTNGTWGNYTSFTRQFADLPTGATGPGKTFMLIHNVDVRKSANTNFESRIQLYGVPGVVYIDTHRFVGSNNLWPRFNHISFIKCDVNPIFTIGVCSAGAQSDIYSTLILVPLN